MNRLEGHIGFLLFENDFIIVPGLGGFVINKEQAYADDVKRTLFAPRHWIGFNQALTHNDGLLVQLYMRSQAISSLKAEEVIKRDVAELRKRLFVSKSIALGNWGKLYLDEEGTVCFSNATETTFVKPQLIGLEDISIHTLTEIRAENTRDVSSKKSLVLKKSVAFVSTSVAAALLLFAISIPISEKRDNGNQLAGFFPERIAGVTRTMSKSVDSSKNVHPIGLLQEKKTKVLNNTEIKKDTLADAAYFLIVGTFQTVSVANKELKSLQDKGFDGSGIIGSVKAKRVYVAKFRSIGEANKYLSHFVEQNPRHKDAWIYNLKKSDECLN